MKFTYSRGQIVPKFGYFYELDTDNDPRRFDAEVTEGKLSAIQPNDETDALILRVASNNSVYFGSCCRHTFRRSARCEVMNEGGGEIGTIAWCATAWLCNENLAVQLLTANLTGLTVAQIDFAIPGTVKQRWFQVCSDGRKGIAKYRVDPEPYKCWNCGHEPVCHECGSLEPYCSECDCQYFVNEPKWEGDSDRRLVICTSPYPYSVVDLKSWDGSDFVGGLISHRLLQFLLSVHAHPFRAIPRPVNIANATKGELARLENAKGPISR